MIQAKTVRNNHFFQKKTKTGERLITNYDGKPGSLQYRARRTGVPEGKMPEVVNHDEFGEFNEGNTHEERQVREER